METEKTLIYNNAKAHSFRRPRASPPPIPAAAKGSAAIANKWRLISLLGRGGFAEVWHAQNVDTQLDVAVKLLTLESEEARERFSREVGALVLPRHAGVVRVLEVGRSGGRNYYVMDLVKGTTLRQALDKGIRLATALWYARQIAVVMADVHKAGIVHRDLSPENVMLCRDGQCTNNTRVVLIDFGYRKSPAYRRALKTSSSWGNGSRLARAVRCCTRLGNGVRLLLAWDHGLRDARPSGLVEAH